MILLKYWKPILGLVLVLAAFAGGWYLRPIPAPQTVTIEKEVIKKEIREKIRIVEKHPDGIEIIREEERRIDEDSRRDNKQIVQPSLPLPKYSLGLKATSKLTYKDMLGYQDYSYTVTAGRRIYQTPGWVELGYDWRRHELSLGLRWEL